MKGERHLYFQHILYISKYFVFKELYCSFNITPFLLLLALVVTVPAVPKSGKTEKGLATVDMNTPSCLKDCF